MILLKALDLGFKNSVLLTILFALEFAQSIKAGDNIAWIIFVGVLICLALKETIHIYKVRKIYG